MGKQGEDSSSCRQEGVRPFASDMIITIEEGPRRLQGFRAGRGMEEVGNHEEDMDVVLPCVSEIHSHSSIIHTRREA